MTILPDPDTKAATTSASVAATPTEPTLELDNAPVRLNERINGIQAWRNQVRTPESTDDNQTSPTLCSVLIDTPPATDDPQLSTGLSDVRDVVQTSATEHQADTGTANDDLKPSAATHSSVAPMAPNSTSSDGRTSQEEEPQQRQDSQPADSQVSLLREAKVTVHQVDSVSQPDALLVVEPTRRTDGHFRPGDTLECTLSVTIPPKMKLKSPIRYSMSCTVIHLSPFETDSRGRRISNFKTAEPRIETISRGHIDLAPRRQQDEISSMVLDATMRVPSRRPGYSRMYPPPNAQKFDVYMARIDDFITQTENFFQHGQLIPSCDIMSSSHSSGRLQVTWTVDAKLKFVSQPPSKRGSFAQLKHFLFPKQLKVRASAPFQMALSPPKADEVGWPRGVLAGSHGSLKSIKTGELLLPYKVRQQLCNPTSTSEIHQGATPPPASRESKHECRGCAIENCMRSQRVASELGVHTTFERRGSDFLLAGTAYPFRLILTGPPKSTVTISERLGSIKMNLYRRTQYNDGWRSYLLERGTNLLDANITGPAVRIEVSRQIVNTDGSALVEGTFCISAQTASAVERARSSSIGNVVPVLIPTCIVPCNDFASATISYGLVIDVKFDIAYESPDADATRRRFSLLPARPLSKRFSLFPAKASSKRFSMLSPRASSHKGTTLDSSIVSGIYSLQHHIERLILYARDAPMAQVEAIQVRPEVKADVSNPFESLEDRDATSDCGIGEGAAEALGGSSQQAREPLDNCDDGKGNTHVEATQAYGDSGHQSRDGSSDSADTTHEECRSRISAEAICWRDGWPAEYSLVAESIPSLSDASVERASREDTTVAPSAEKLPTGNDLAEEPASIDEPARSAAPSVPEDVDPNTSQEEESVRQALAAAPSAPCSEVQDFSAYQLPIDSADFAQGQADLTSMRLILPGSGFRPDILPPAAYDREREEVNSAHQVRIGPEVLNRLADRLLGVVRNVEDAQYVLRREAVRQLQRETQQRAQQEAQQETQRQSQRQPQRQSRRRSRRRSAERALQENQPPAQRQRTQQNSSSTT
ncbi:unnamed protein product [Sympodiomycopsis kandeliae]